MGVRTGPSGRGGTSARLSGPGFFEAAMNAEPADPCHGLPSGDDGSVGGNDYKSSAAKSPAPPNSAASGADGVGPVKSGAAARPRLAVVQQKPKKTVRFAK